MSEGDMYRMKLAEQLEASLGPAKLVIWQTLHGMLPAGHPYVASDWGLELYLLNAIIGGAQVRDLVRCIPKVMAPRGPDRRHEPDRRMLAAHDVGGA